MVSALTFIKNIHSAPLCILNNLITTLIMYRFIKTFLGNKINHKLISYILYFLFFTLVNILSFQSTFMSIPYYINKYFVFGLYLMLFAAIIFISFCYKPSVSTGLSSATLTAISLYSAIPIAEYIFDSLYLFIVPNFDLFNNTSGFRHIFYLIFEQYQQCFIYIIEIIIRLLFLFVILRVRHIYEERNMYYSQAAHQHRDVLELKQFRHDIKNHVGVLNQMISSGEVNKALEYLSAINEMSDASKLFSRTENIALDSIVNYKLCEAQKLGIRCSYSAIIPQNIHIEDKDFIIILGNLLDNAIEACLKLEENKYIDVILKYDKGILFIFVTNSYNGVVEKNNTKFISLKTNKSLHGLGLKNVQKTLSHYDGSLMINTDNHKFSVSAMMYIK